MEENSLLDLTESTILSDTVNACFESDSNPEEAIQLIAYTEEAGIILKLLV
jgi:hypothetical protein